ncbi:MAG TPA: hypothetical protein PKO06_24630, partial [Candidatus Ozemobacteraceae bacterium]|nr:hypothetical protein [Candidatus Ozemobacteraceae bacterium]
MTRTLQLLLFLSLVTLLVGVCLIEARKPGPVTFLVRDDGQGVLFLESIPPDYDQLTATTTLDIGVDPGPLTAASGLASGEYHIRFPYPLLASEDQLSSLADRFVKDAMSSGTFFIQVEARKTRLGYLYLYRWEYGRFSEFKDLTDIAHILSVLIDPWRRVIF